MNARQNKHSGRIEVKAGLKVIQGWQATYQNIWSKACEHDKIPPDSKFVEFSKDNPFVQFLDSARKNYLSCINEYKTGGYVGLKMS